MTDDTEKLYELGQLITPMAIRVAATLRLADWITAGTTTLTELAAAVDADPDALGRLLRYLAARNIFAEPEPGRFALTSLAEPLRDDHPDQVRAWLDLTGAIGRADLGFCALLDVIRTGNPGHAMVHGRDFWADLASNPELAESYDASITWHRARVRTVPWLVARDWSGTQHVVDVGGGTGSLLVPLLQAHPHLKGTLVELPGAAAVARQALVEGGLSGRGDVVTGSFFDPLPAGADVYLLTTILHNWNDTDATTILRQCAKAANRGGRVLLFDLVAAGEENRQVFTYWDLHMLVYLGGRERTLEDFTALTDAAGLAITSVTPSMPGPSLIDCTVL